ncbi:MAG: hypothetical protein ACJAW8_002441 [Oleispira sp.]|jgi:hypothetical protein
MKLLKRITLLATSHIAVAGLAFSLGIYTLPIIMAPADPSSSTLALTIKSTRYVATIADNLTDSDWLHWGKGTFSIGDDYIIFQGKLAPGPAYRLYLSPTFIETEKDFIQMKSTMVEVGEIKSFANHILPLSNDIALEEYNSVVVWCEAFNQFITAAQFKR